MSQRDVVKNYENYREEDRLTTNQARKIEYLTTIRVLDEVLGSSLDILDCAAGTGIYSFYLAEKGHRLTATDITPRHVHFIEEALKEKRYSMNTAVLDAVDMSIFSDETFDVVLNMGPFYHLTEGAQRQQCMSEAVRVLKKGGYLFTAYIPRFYVFEHVALSDRTYLDRAFADQIVRTGVLRHEDEKCFWTDTYYSTKEEMESIYGQFHLEVTDHFAQDGLTPLFADTVDRWNQEEFETWCDYHYSVCREASVLGASNHVMIVGRKG